jgi:hypothetical protein
VVGLLFHWTSGKLLKFKKLIGLSKIKFKFIVFIIRRTYFFCSLGAYLRVLRYCKIPLAGSQNKLALNERDKGLEYASLM